MSEEVSVQPIPQTIRKAAGILLLGFLVLGGGMAILSNMASQVP